MLSTTIRATPEAKGAKDASKHPGIISKDAKASVGVKAAKGVAKHPGTSARPPRRPWRSWAWRPPRSIPA